MGDRGPIWTLERGQIGALRLESAKDAYARRDTQEAVTEAEELLDLEPDNHEAMLIVADGSLELGQPEVARVAYQDYLELCPEDALGWAGLAVAAYEVTDLHACIEAADKALGVDDEGAEAWYYKGLCLEHLGRRDEADICYFQASRRDSQSFPLVAEVSDATFAAALAEALLLLPQDLRDWLDPIPIRIEELPDLAELRSAIPPLSPSAGALYDGMPPEDDPITERPSAIRLFRRNIARAASYGADLVHLIAHALRQEALDWLALDDEAFPLPPSE